METKLIEGDPLNPNDFDILVQSQLLSVNDPVPNGWRVMTGNHKTSTIMRVAYRHEIAGNRNV